MAIVVAFVLGTAVASAVAPLSVALGAAFGGAAPLIGILARVRVGLVWRARGCASALLVAISTILSGR